MAHQLFPTSITQFSTESLIKRHSTKSKAIYWLLILSVVAFVVAIFWIKVDVNVHSRGIITSKERISKLIAPIFGKVLYFNIKENREVKQGDTLFIIDTVKILNSINISQEKLQLLNKQTADLEYLGNLTKNSLLNESKLESGLYKQELRRFRAELKYQKSEITIAHKSHLRQTQLYNKKILPKAEYEQFAFKYENAKLMYHKIFDSQLARWQNQRNTNINQLYSLNENLNNLHKELEKCYVLSPINGYVQNLKGIKKESLVYPNQEICTISPTTELIVETAVSTSDIGLINLNQEVKFRIDAFNFNQWGMLEGNVSEIANDISVSENGIPTFMIRCKLNSKQLTYQGKTVIVKKGMTVNANFFLIQRTLAQMFYDNITDWFDPNQIEK